MTRQLGCIKVTCPNKLHNCYIINLYKKRVVGIFFYLKVFQEEKITLTLTEMLKSVHCKQT